MGGEKNGKKKLGEKKIKWMKILLEKINWNTEEEKIFDLTLKIKKIIKKIKKN